MKQSTPEPRPGAKPESKPKRADNRQRGVALIAASVAMAIVSAVVVEFATNTNVDIYAAKSAELDMKAHFLARSGMNIAELVIKLQERVDNLPEEQGGGGSIQIADFLEQIIGAFGGSKEERDAWAELVGGISADEIKGLGVPEGEFSLQITTEDNKININCASPSGTTSSEKKSVAFQLLNLIFLDAYDPIFEKEDAERWRRDRQTQVKAIIDYVDADNYIYEWEEGLVARIREDYGYETLSDKYKPKEKKLDTAGEIRQIRGIDDRFWTLFGSSLTVYGDCKINLAAVDNVGMIASLISYARKNEEDPVVADQLKLWRLAQKVKEARDFGYSFNSVDEFIELVGDPSGGLAGFLDQQSAQGVDAPDGAENGPPVEGVELDKNKLNQIAKTGPRVTYRVEAVALMKHGGLNTSLEKRMVGIWDTRRPKQNTRAYGTQQVAAGDKGRWVYWRED